MSGRRARERRKRETRAYIGRFLRTYIGVLRGILKRRAPDLPADARRPCHSCAFNPSTDTLPGFEKTMLGLIRSLDTGEPFYCHEGLPTDPATGEWYYDPREPLPARCAGWEAIADDPDAKRAGVRAIATVGAPPKRVRLRRSHD